MPTLSRLNYLALPSIKSLKMGPEDMLSYELAIWLRTQYFDGKLNAVFTHIANEGAGKVAMIRKKAIGMMPGAADWLITDGRRIVFIELKAGKNKQSAAQIEFNGWCNEVGVPYAVCYTLEAAIAFIKDAGFVRQ